ncbi:hypothetical protein [Scytonema sp. NUACC26]
MNSTDLAPGGGILVIALTGFKTNYGRRTQCDRLPTDKWRVRSHDP